MSDFTLISQTGSQSLRDKLAALMPPASAAPLVQRSPAVQAALAKNALRTAEIAHRSARRPRSKVLRAVDGFVAACGIVPYALIALAVRLVMARVFFLTGQGLVDGPRIPIDIPNVLQWAVTLPAGIKAQTVSLFAIHFAAVPVPPAVAAYLVSYAEFILPVLLVVGLATRFAALGLLAITAIVQVFVSPDALWSTHIYWIALLGILVAMGPGAFSADHVIRWVARHR